MKYENEINEIINNVIPKEGLMTDEEHQEIIEETFKQMGITKQKLSDDIETGVKNGYSVINEINQIIKVNEEYIELVDSNTDDDPDDYLLEMEKICE